ncbi:MAG: glycerol-3-phosphate 1-O-acyltransferase PlsY [Endomicrobiales bacterium]|jgi:glycerol-3-phosphate acyltransferase PlsY
MRLIGLCIFSYLLGSIPVSFLLGKLLKGIDIRQHGSGNPGATNVFRVLGPVPGIVTFVLDALKGFVPVAIAVHMAGNELSALIAGLCAILGHMYTLFLGFKGGKGVATSAGVFGALLPGPTALALATFAIVFALFRYVSLGSIAAALVLPLCAWYVDSFSIKTLCAALVAVIIIYKHRSNIRRLIDGTENKITFTRKKP